MRAAAALLLALLLQAAPALGGHGGGFPLPMPLDIGGMERWPDGWDLQAPGHVHVARAGDAVLVAGAWAQLTGGAAETWAPCDVWSHWNGLDGRWYVAPRAADGTRFTHYDVRVSGLDAGVAVAMYRGADCAYLGWHANTLPDGAVKGTLPAAADMLYVTPTLPAPPAPLAPAAPGQLAEARLDVALCLRGGCAMQPGETPGAQPWAHPNPPVLGLLGGAEA